MVLLTINDLANIINIILVAALVIITAYYARQTNIANKLSKDIFIFQRKPYAYTNIRNRENEIFCDIINYENSKSAVKDLTMRIKIYLNDKKHDFGKYSFKGPLLPSEKITLELTNKIREVFIEKNLMEGRVEKVEPDDETYARYGIPEVDETFYDITKKRFNFIIQTHIMYRSDDEKFSDYDFENKRKYRILFKSLYDDPQSKYDLYETNVHIKGGTWDQD